MGCIGIIAILIIVIGLSFGLEIGTATFILACLIAALMKEY